MINYVSTFSREFIAIEEQFKSGKYGPEWTFSRWLGVKCGISHRTTYRMIEQIHRVSSDDQRERAKRALQDEYRRIAQLETDRRATQLAWNGWLAEEKQRTNDVQVCWDGWLAEEKQRIGTEKEAARQAKKKAAARARKRRQRKRDQKVKKEQQIKAIDDVTPSAAENEKAVPNVALVEVTVNCLVGALDQLPVADRMAWIERIITRLEAVLKCCPDTANVIAIRR